MIVTVVRFELPTPISVDDARERFGANAAQYLTVPGLLFKAYIRSEDGQIAGGVYWWTDRASAAAKFNDGWRAGMQAKYGADPSIEYFDAPVVVDAVDGMIRVEPPLMPDTAAVPAVE